jgi:hypothetical protein
MTMAPLFRIKLRKAIVFVELKIFGPYFLAIINLTATSEKKIGMPAHP